MPENHNNEQSYNNVKKTELQSPVKEEVQDVKEKIQSESEFVPNKSDEIKIENNLEKASDVLSSELDQMNINSDETEKTNVNKSTTELLDNGDFKNSENEMNANNTFNDNLYESVEECYTAVALYDYQAGNYTFL